MSKNILTTKKIYTLAYYQLLFLWSDQKQRNNTFQNENGRPNYIGCKREERYWNEIEQISELLTKLEKGEIEP